MDTENFTQCSFDPAIARQRFQRMNLRTSGKNCISAALYLSGVTKEERYIDTNSVKEVLSYYFISLGEYSLWSVVVPTQAVLLALIQISKPETYYHLALIDPDDRNRVLHRPFFSTHVRTDTIKNMLKGQGTDPSKDSVLFFANKLP